MCCRPPAISQTNFDIYLHRTISHLVLHEASEEATGHEPVEFSRILPSNYKLKGLGHGNVISLHVLVRTLNAATVATHGCNVSSPKQIYDRSHASLVGVCVCVENLTHM